MALTIGSACSGYGGLDMAVEWLFGARTIWHADPAPGPTRILAARWPGVPNHGDITRLDWADVQRPDILTAGYPCQPFALSGRRQGANDDRHLWPHVRDAIRTLRPRLAILENVAGHRSLGFDRVLGDLAEDGFDARWTSVRAADVGACHGRERLFVAVTDPDAQAITHTRRQEQPCWAGLRADDTAGLWRSRSSDRASDHRIRWQGHPEAEAVDAWAGILGRPAPEPLVNGPRGGPVLNPRFVEWMQGLPDGHVTDVQGIDDAAQLEALGNGVVPQQATFAILELLGVSLLTDGYVCK